MNIKKNAVRLIKKLLHWRNELLGFIYCTLPSKKNISHDLLPLAELPKPYEYTGVAVSLSDTQAKKAKSFADLYGFSSTNLTSSMILINSGTISDSAEACCAFDGMAVCNSKFVYGCDDIENLNISVDSLRECTGEFTLFEYNHHKCKAIMSADFFGIRHIYYYKDETIFVAANSYHFLLLLLQYMSVPLEINKPQFIANLSARKRDNSSFDMSVKNVYRLPVHNRIAISDSGVIFENTEVYDILFTPEKYDADKYHVLCEAAKDEIIGNVRAVIESRHFDYVRMDLSGGNDTRIVYSTLSYLPKVLTDRVRINSCQKFQFTSQNDFEIAKQINEIYNYKWETPVVLPDDSDFYEKYRSICFGYYFTHWKSMPAGKISNTITLTGGGGAIVRWVNGDRSKVREKYSIKLHHEIPGRTPKERASNEYMYISNNCHFSGVKNALRCPMFQPLLSKSMLKARTMLYEIEYGSRTTHTLLELLDPELAKIPRGTSPKTPEISEPFVDKKYYTKKVLLQAVNDLHDVLHDSPEMLKSLKKKIIINRPEITDNNKRQDEEVFIMRLLCAAEEAKIVKLSGEVSVSPCGFSIR